MPRRDQLSLTQWYPLAAAVSHVYSFSLHLPPPRFHSLRLTAEVLLSISVSLRGRQEILPMGDIEGRSRCATQEALRLFVGASPFPGQVGCRRKSNGN